jgi:hypothetical protein
MGANARDYDYSETSTRGKLRRSRAWHHRRDERDRIGWTLLQTQAITTPKLRPPS